MIIATKIKELRERDGMSQAELAKKLGVSRNSVKAWESGVSSPTTKYLINLSEIFRVSTDYILGRSDDNKVSVSGLSNEEVRLVCELINHLGSKGVRKT